MFLTIIAGSIVLVLVWQFIQSRPEPVNGVYRQPGRWYHLKKFVFMLLLKVNKSRNKKKDAKESYDSRGYGRGIHNIHVLEDVQELEKDDYVRYNCSTLGMEGCGVNVHKTISQYYQAIDAVYYGGFSKDGSRLALRIGRRHNRQSEMWLVIEIPGIGRLHHPLHPDTLCSNVASHEYRAGGLKIEMIEPMKRWKISYNGQLRWKTVTEPFSFDTDMNQTALADAVAREPWTKRFFKKLRSTHQTHYEQWGELSGKIKIEGFEEKPVSFMCIRDHSFGIRDWRSFYRYAIHFIYLENGTMIQAGVVSSPSTMSHIRIGYLMHSNSATHSLSDIDLKLWEVAAGQEPTNEYSFNFYAGGKKYHTEVTGEWTPTWYHHDDRGSKVFEKFCKYKINGIKGYGLVEFHYRNPEGISYVPQESVPMLEEPLDDKVKGQMDDITLTFADTGCCSSRLVGGKGAQLGLLTSIQNKVDSVVPRGFCVTLAAFNKQIQVYPEISRSIDKILAIIRYGNHDNLQSVCSDTVELIATSPICQQVSESIQKKLKETFVDVDNVYVAVRSSASGEDGTEASSAGQMETFLGIKGEKEILNAVRKCWASAFTFQAVQYRRMNGQHIKVCVGVVIQEMVQSEVSGVLFTNNPVTGSANEMMINASYGLGEAVVSGVTTPDTVIVHRSWDDQLKVLTKNLGEKTKLMTVKEGGGVIEKDIDKENACCMTDEQILQLCYKAVLIEHYFGSPRDIEWAMYGGKLYLLQARPITTLDHETNEDLIHEFDDPLVTGREFLTTGNIGEMMPGAVTPLTNSIFKNALNFALERYSEITVGTSPSNHTDKNVLSCCGSLFLNLTQLDVMAINNIIGKKDAGELSLVGQSVNELSIDDVIDYCGGLNPFYKRFWIFLRSFSKLKKKVELCESWYEKVKTYKIGENESTCSGFYKDINRKLKDYYEIWETSLVKSGQSGVWAAVVVNILLQGKTEYTTEVCADVALLLSKCDEVYSAEVPTAIQNLAKEIDKTGNTDKFLSCSNQECVDFMKSSEWPNVKNAFDSFMEHHGHRYVREAEVFERSWRAQPDKLVQSLKVVLKNKLFDQKPREILTCDEAVARIKTKLPWMARKLLRHFLPKARKAVGQREWGKSLSIKVADKFKEAYWTLADMMVKEGRIPEKELLFFLTHTEIGKLLETRSPKLISKSIRRRKLFPRQMELKFHKMNVGRPLPIQTEDISIQRTATFSLKGMPVCHGVVTGVCRVVKSLPEADSIQAGDILIVLYTDIGWSPYFPLISGLVTEIGGLVSHGAVVAREFGLPCIVNVPNATNLFQSGDTVRLDGQAGIIERLEC